MVTAPSVMSPFYICFPGQLTLPVKQDPSSPAFIQWRRLTKHASQIQPGKTKHFIFLSLPKNLSSPSLLITIHFFLSSGHYTPLFSSLPLHPFCCQIPSEHYIYKIYPLIFILPSEVPTSPLGLFTSRKPSCLTTLLKSSCTLIFQYSPGWTLCLEPSTLI